MNSDNEAAYNKFIYVSEDESSENTNVKQPKTKPEQFCHALLRAMKDFDAETISLFYKYVDDILTSIHTNEVELVKKKISATVNMELTVTNEDDNRDIEFLDCIFHRNSDQTISSRWFKKS